jgi:hypothetical protein
LTAETSMPRVTLAPTSIGRHVEEVVAAQVLVPDLDAGVDAGGHDAPRGGGTGVAERCGGRVPPAHALLSLADAERLLVTAMEQATVATPTAGGIKNKMIALDLAFDKTN